MTRAADWLMAYWTHGAVLCALAWVVARRAVLGPAARAVLWRVALLAPPLTATVAMVATLAAPESDPATRATTRALSVTSALRPHVAPRWRGRDVSVHELRRGEMTSRRVVVVDPLERAVSGAVCAAAAAATSLGALGLWRRRRRAARVLAERTPLGVHGAPALSVALSAAPGLASPVALRGGEICVPADDWPALGVAECRGVLLHELAHVERADPAWLDAARVVAALAWWQPLHRVALRGLRRDAELAADDLALERGADPRALVAALAHFARRADGDALPVGAGLAAADSPLVARARRILDPASRPPETTSPTVLLAAVIVTLVALALAPRPSAADGGSRGPTAETVDVQVVRVVR